MTTENDGSTQEASSLHSPGCISAVEVHDRPSQQNAFGAGGVEPLNPNPPGKGHLKKLFTWARESPDWLKRHPLGQVHWDMRCQRCGFTITDKVCTPHKGNLCLQEGAVKILQWSSAIYRGCYETLCTNCQPLKKGDEYDD